jgi:fructan beta-fructosidase
LRDQHASAEGLNIAAAHRLLKEKPVRGDTLEIVAEIDPGGATEVGLKVRKGPDEETVIGYDAKESKLFVDRTRSGNTGFDQKFPGRHAGPLHVLEGKSVKLHIFVDRSSVEVFGNDGETVISDSIFPARPSRDIELYSRGGRARILKLEVWTLRSAWQ